jgi:hypothetical protein
MSERTKASLKQCVSRICDASNGYKDAMEFYDRVETAVRDSGDEQLLKELIFFGSLEQLREKAQASVKRYEIDQRRMRVAFQPLLKNRQA